jgi:cytochrome c oxidase cbb3-type subunit III
MRLQLAVLIAALALVSCDPPGKPKPEEAQAENREAILDFKTLYQSNCAGCHGDDGKNGPARILNDALYLSIIPRDTLKNVIVYGRRGTEMPAWGKNQGGALSHKQVDALVDGIYSNWGKSSADPNTPKYAASSKGDPAHGKQLFTRGCFMCHGPGAPIGTVTSPAYLQLVSSQMLRTSIILGRTDLGMPSYRILNLGKPLSDQDVTDLVAYLDSLRISPAPGVSGMGGEQQSANGEQRENESGTGHEGVISKGNEGSGNGPGSPRHQGNEGIKGEGSSSQGGVK